MKNKILKREHFEYLDKIVQILGFKSLADYDTCITYETLKKSQNNVCDKINLILSTFKQLFPLNEFDLRKNKYNFENIDQVIGFVKKLFFYLNVPIEYMNKTVRLIPQNKLYNEYIKMTENRDIPQIDSNIFDVDNAYMKKCLEELHKPSKKIDEYVSYSKILESNDFTNLNRVIESYLINDNFELNESELDLIEILEFIIPENNKTYKITINFGDNLILTQEINRFNNKIFVNLPNWKNCLLHNKSKLDILKNEVNYCEDMTSSKNMLKINLHGIILKTAINEQYIKFDHDTNFYSFDSIYVFDNDKIARHVFEQENIKTVYFSSILKYLKRPYIKQYIINDYIDLSTLEFKYFHTLRIAQSEHKTIEQLKVGTIIKLKLAGCVEYEKIITKDDIFDGKYYVLNMNLPNCYFYQYHRCELLINSEKTEKYFVEIIGSDLKMSFPESKLSQIFLLDHDEKWNQPGKYIYMATSGMIYKRQFIYYPSDKTNPELIIKQLYKEEKLHKSIFNFNGIEFNCLNVDNVKNDKIESDFGFTLLVGSQTNEYYKGYDSVAINNWTTLKPYMRKIIGDKVHNYYYLHRSTDFMLEMKLLNLEGYKYDAYIMSNGIKYTNFNEPFNLIGNSQAKIIIETNIDDMDDFEIVDVCVRGVYTNQENRRTLANIK